jgi:DNA-binding LacI/PurR family transcriptional regulator
MARSSGNRGGSNIYDVAQRSGVSISTVSLALNSPDRVRPETLTKVLAAVDELGFIPKAEAASRARKGTKRVGVVAPFTSYPSFLERLRGVMAAASENRIEIVIYDDESAALRHHFVDSLPLSRKLDGLVFMGVAISDRFAGRLREDGLHTVLVEFPRPGFSCVVVDDNAGGRMVAEYLLERGHRSVAHIGEALAEETAEGEPLIATQSRARLAGFRDALASTGVELARSATIEVAHSADSARQATHTLLTRADRPTAIFAHDDVLAAGVLKAARELSLDVPGELAVVGFDDLDFADYLGLTTVRQPLFESGRLAMRLLGETMAEGASALARTVSLPLELITRDTA